MFVGPGVIITDVDIEHGANASPGQQSPVRAAAFPANFDVTGGQMPPSTTGFGDEREEKKVRPWAVHNRRKEGSILY
jgi:hypothetical protein